MQASVCQSPPSPLLVATLSFLRPEIAMWYIVECGKLFSTMTFNHPPEMTIRKKSDINIENNPLKVIKDHPPQMLVLQNVYSNN